MQQHDFEFGIDSDADGPLIRFSNTTASFVEVVFELPEETVSGYCFPPHSENSFRRNREGLPIKFGGRGTARAKVFAGVGRFKSETTDYLSVPTFIRRKLGARRKVLFRRATDRPSLVLEASF